MLPGAYANVHLHLAKRSQQLVIPTGAVLFQAEGPQAVVVNADNRLELRQVGIGNDLGNVIEITSGLSPTDRVVTSPPDYVVNGMLASIQPQPGSSPAPTAGNTT